ncbi:hypothetical protein Misp01_55610 [Microtetraspora sp. NBRC 13810]|uniref:DUF2637 domain-containing protein n=1 Tax=Microtetraspora sp. NBRC 13810 TaxID=3030990 RepID=UPI0024A19CF4|nr:DUF2637 domain-containing protein [Microtetraspora sp. NBRC 13810]GLW10433.1 hypothetical protein Misp01_55610 [Microtetraspora sp. NBRC 13810]
MNVTPPAAAGTSSRPSAPVRQSGMTLTLRRLGIAVVGLGVAALGATACVLSFDDLRALAVTGRARPDLAYLYPAAFDALLAVALISVLLLCTGRLPVRLQAGAVLVLLIAGAVAADVATAMQATVDVRQAAIVVAVAPWAMLTIALWLWLLMIKHAHARREPVDAEPAAGEFVPFQRPEAAPPLPIAPSAERAARDEPLPEPAHPLPEPARPLPEMVPAAEPMAPVPSAGASVPSGAPVAHAASVAAKSPAPKSAAPESAVPESAALDEPAPGNPVPAFQAVDDTGSPALGRRPRPQRQPDMPLRWGDVIRSNPRREPEDVLVHPRRETESAHPLGERVETWAAAPSRHGGDTDEADRQTARASEKDRDTQPLRTLPDTRPGAVPAARGAQRPAEDAVERSLEDTGPMDPIEIDDRAHGSEMADRDEPRTAGAREDESAPPSARTRSTPVPPLEDAGQ